MTLILVIPSKKGLVMASDGQATTPGGIKITYKKIHKLNDYCIWGAASDNVLLVERVEERIAALSEKDKSLQTLCSTLCDLIPGCVEELSIPQQPSQPYAAQFVFVEYRDNPRILFARENGSADWRPNTIFAIGSGVPFAQALLRKYQFLEKLDLELAKVLAYKIVAETIEVTEGVGPPIDVWQLPPAENLTKEQLTGLEDTCTGLREAEIEMFLKAVKS
jgi:20S proteasome alpha/beta subunit